MVKSRCVRGVLAIAGAIALHVSLLGQVAGIPKQHAAGQGVTPVYEGWFRSGDFLYLSYGYYNLNQREVLSVAVGPDNKIEPGGPDQGQPTSFTPDRHTGVFAVRVPKDVEQRLKVEKSTITWTLTVNGKTFAIPANLENQYNINALLEPASGNTPPKVGFSPDALNAVGPYGIRMERNATVGQPLKLDVYVTDDGVVKAQEAAKPGMVVLTWDRFRGSGNVVFAEPQPKAAGIAIGKTGHAETTATFSAPGKYTVWLDVIDQSRRDFQCCWTNVYVDVNVAGGSQE
jgi:hypothetical protein